MSQLIVEVCTVESVSPHPNATKLCIAKIKGWEVCIQYDPETGKSQFEPGDKCVYIPYDAVIPFSLANGPTDDPAGRLNVAKYCAPVKNEFGELSGYRVRATKLRGYKSFGLIMVIDPNWGDDPNWEVGTNVADHYGITKWEPPENCQDGDAEKPNPRFHTYTDIEKWQNFPDAIPEGTEVVLTEKIHGMNCRLGYVLDRDELGNAQWIFMAGSHSVRRKKFTKEGKPSQFWLFLMDGDAQANLLSYLASDEFQWHVPKLGIIIFGEIYGSGVQDMTYGLKNGARKFRAFDIAINEEYLDFDLKLDLFNRFAVPQVPILYRGPFSAAILEKYTTGDTTTCDLHLVQGFKGREGTVCTPVKEYHSPILNGRCIVKSVSVDYLGRKGATDNR